MIAVVNMKGGVGKSSTVVGLADQLAASETGRVLVIDVDTQATASYFLAGDKALTELIEGGKTIDQFLVRALIENDHHVMFPSFIRERATNTTNQNRELDISLIASSTTVRASERDIIRKLTTNGSSLVDIEQTITATLKKQISALKGKYRFILVDCAPGISPFTTAAIGLADLVLVPTVPDAPSFYGLSAYLKSVHGDMTFHSAQRPPHVLITRHIPKPKAVMGWLRSKGKLAKTSHQAEYIQKIEDLAKKSDPKFTLLKTKMMETPLMPHAMSLGADDSKDAPTLSQKYPGALGQNLEQLATEIMEVLK